MKGKPFIILFISNVATKNQTNDLVQEAFIKLCNIVPGDQDKAKSFLYTVANNLFWMSCTSKWFWNTRNYSHEK